MAKKARLIGTKPLRQDWMKLDCVGNTDAGIGQVTGLTESMSSAVLQCIESGRKLSTDASSACIRSMSLGRMMEAGRQRSEMLDERGWLD